MTNDDQKTPDPAVRAMDGLRSLVRAIGASSRTAGKTGGISGAQLFALREISASPGISIGELATRTMARQSSVSELVARLDEHGLISRNAGDDARQVNLSLTAKGRRAIGDSRATAQERLIAGFQILPPATQASLADGLVAWLAASGLADVPPTMFFEHSDVAASAPRKRARHKSGSAS